METGSLFVARNPLQVPNQSSLNDEHPHHGQQAQDLLNPTLPQQGVAQVPLGWWAPAHHPGATALGSPH